MWHFRPSADELLDAVEDYLRGLTHDNWNRDKLLESRIAANCTAIIQREQAAKIKADRELNKKLADFMEITGTTEQLIDKLSLRIRDNVYELEDPELHDLITYLSVARLKIENPRYPALREVISEYE